MSMHAKLDSSSSFASLTLLILGRPLILMLVLVLVLVLTLKLTLMAVLNTPDLALSLRPHANLVIAVNHMLQTNPNQDDNCVVQACSTW